MKALKLMCMCVLVLLWSGAAFAQDPVKVDSAHYKVIFENASVRVLKINYAAGAKSQMHQHPDAIVVPLADSKVQFTMPDGKAEDASLATKWPSTCLRPRTTRQTSAQARSKPFLSNSRRRRPARPRSPRPVKGWR